MSGTQQALIASGAGHVAAWRTVVDLTIVGSSGGWGGYTLRHVYTTAVLSGSATKLRMTLDAPALTSTIVNKLYVQEAAASGDVYDFASTPVQVTVGGSGSFTITNGTEVLSDEITLAITGTKSLVIAAYFTGGTALATHSGAPAGMSAYYLGADEATTINASTGYTLSGSGVVVRKLELYG